MKLTKNYLRRLITEVVEQSEKPDVQFPEWLKTKLEQVHGKPGQGSVFAKSIDEVVTLINSTIDKTGNIAEIAGSTGTISTKVPGIGYNLVLKKDVVEQMKQQGKLKVAKEGETQKTEGPNTLNVPAVWVSNSSKEFATDQLTIIVRPMKDQGGQPVPNKFIILSAFPGDPSIPPASKWNGEYVVIIPDIKSQTQPPVSEGLKNKIRRLIKEVLSESDFRQKTLKKNLLDYLMQQEDNDDSMYPELDEYPTYEEWKKAAISWGADPQNVVDFETQMNKDQEMQSTANADALGYHTGEF